MKVATEKTPFSRTTRTSRRKGKPASISVSQTEMVKESALQPDQMLPLVIQPNMAGLKLTDWAKNNLSTIEAKVHQHGGILFRGFAVDTQDAFDEFVGQVCPELMTYMEGATPRTKLSNKVYTSTEFPQEQSIDLHNELSYVMSFPNKIWFCCVIEAETGGETPIADVRQVYQRLTPEIRDKFEAKGWMLVRNFGDGFGPTWQNAYHMEDKADLEAYFDEANINWEWKDGDRLRTRQVRPAVITHPKTSEMLWFNHIAFWHQSSLADDIREKLLADFQPDELPYNTFYGDGSPIESDVAAALRAAYDAETVMFPWQKGDVLMLDNMLVAHGRSPFTGQRRVLAAMGEPYTRTDVDNG